MMTVSGSNSDASCGSLGSGGKIFGGVVVGTGLGLGLGLGLVGVGLVGVVVVGGGVVFLDPPKREEKKLESALIKLENIIGYHW